MFVVVFYLFLFFTGLIITFISTIGTEIKTSMFIKDRTKKELEEDFAPLTEEEK